MCVNCDEIIQVGNSGTDGWSPILALYEGECDGDAVTVHQLVSWQEGSGTRPLYNGNIMTDQWLIDHPIYLGSTGFVTDICNATDLKPDNGGEGGPGPEGPQGIQGEPGCNPLADISLTFEGQPGVTGAGLTIDFAKTGTACEQSFDGSIDPIEFAQSDFFSEVMNTETFINGVESVTNTTVIEAVNAALSPPITTYTYVGGDIGSKIFCISQTGTVTAALNTSTYNNQSYIQSKIVGNTMFVDFRLFLDISAVSFPASYYLELLIPSSKTYSTNSLNPIGYNLNATIVSLDLVPVISANSSSTSKLRIGFYLANGDVKDIPAFSNLTTTQTFNGSLIFSIN